MFTPVLAMRPRQAAAGPPVSSYWLQDCILERLSQVTSMPWTCHQSAWSQTPALAGEAPGEPPSPPSLSFPTSYMGNSDSLPVWG